MLSEDFMKIIPLLGKEGLGVVAVREPYHPPPPAPPPAEEGGHSHGSRSCLLADRHPETMKMSRPHKGGTGVSPVPSTKPRAGTMPVPRAVTSFYAGYSRSLQYPRRGPLSPPVE
jgi:hypothetical protein